MINDTHLVVEYDVHITKAVTGKIRYQATCHSMPKRKLKRQTGKRKVIPQKTVICVTVVMFITDNVNVIIIQVTKPINEDCQ